MVLPIFNGMEEKELARFSSINVSDGEITISGTTDDFNLLADDLNDLRKNEYLSEIVLPGATSTGLLDMFLDKYAAISPTVLRFTASSSGIETP